MDLCVEERINYGPIVDDHVRFEFEHQNDYDSGFIGFDNQNNQNTILQSSTNTISSMSNQNDFSIVMDGNFHHHHHHHYHHHHHHHRHSLDHSPHIHLHYHHHSADLQQVSSTTMKSPSLNDRTFGQQKQQTHQHQNQQHSKSITEDNNLFWSSSGYDFNYQWCQQQNSQNLLDSTIDDSSSSHHHSNPHHYFTTMNQNTLRIDSSFTGTYEPYHTHR